ncbi:hypothetical protein GS444_24305 [Rhodococcus hoagii]|nr:hypothetical protein [Prescottella equi]
MPDADRFDLLLGTDRPLDVPDGFVLAIGLTTRPGNNIRIDAGTDLDHHIRRLSLVEITPFVTLTVTSPEGLVASTVVVATLVGDPPERLDEVIAAQLKSPEDFLKLIALLLSVQGIHGGTGASWLAAASGGAAGTPLPAFSRCCCRHWRARGRRSGGDRSNRRPPRRPGCAARRVRRTVARGGGCLEGLAGRSHPMSTGFDADAIVAGLRPFQQHTVEHVVDRFYGPDRCSRFLVADETGSARAWSPAVSSPAPSNTSRTIQPSTGSTCCTCAPTSTSPARICAA